MFSLDALDKLSKILKNINPDVSSSLEEVKTSITPSELYKIFGLVDIPKISPQEKGRLLIRESKPFEYELCIDNEQWMYFELKTFIQLFQLYSHYNLAKGHCICTGLGFGLREKWLLYKKEVSKITVLEKNIEVIDYHKQVNSDLINQLEIINCDASEYKGKCDTLLLDHYGNQPYLNLNVFLEDIKKCCDNIEHDVLWFWPLEEFINSLFENDETLVLKRYEKYLNLREEYSTLPDITISQLNSYCDMYNFPIRRKRVLNLSD